jgi:3-hydroxybutyryl-CoA dehydrogenase
MGCFNSLAAAVSGYQVTLYDANAAALEAIPERHREMGAMLVAGGYCTDGELAPAMDRISVVFDLDQAVAQADLVSESIFEDLALKREIHQVLDQTCPPATILTTNSSMLLVSEIEDVVVRGDRFAALHTHLGSPLVDIVPGPRTEPAVIDILRRYVISTGGEPLVLHKEHAGYVLNFLLAGAINAAFSLVLDGLASREQVDMAWMRGWMAPRGPFGLMDYFGLDLVYHQRQGASRGDVFIDGLRERVIAYLRPYVESDLLGVKSGRGFYRYPEPAFEHPDFLQTPLEIEDVYWPLAVAWLGNAMVLRAQGVADEADIDRAWRVGTALALGPSDLLAQVGTQEFLQRLTVEERWGRVAEEKALTIRNYLAKIDE